MPEGGTSPSDKASFMSSQQPPANVSIQPWQSSTQHYGDNQHARSSSMDSLESSGSSSSGSTTAANYQRTAVAEFIPTRTVGKAPKVAANALQFVKVQSPIYKKTDQQPKLTKDVKHTRSTLTTDEDWQSNLDNWKSRRRKVSENIIQRAEEMRQIEVEDQIRQEKQLQQQRKIKKFSEMVEKKSRSYNLDLYINTGDDSGLGGTPEPDEIIDSPNANLRSDTSEGMTSEAESVDSDIHKSDKGCQEKAPPKVPQKPIRKKFLNETDNMKSKSPKSLFTNQDLRNFDNSSSTDPSDTDGPTTGDSETISSEEDFSFLSDSHKSQSDDRILEEDIVEHPKENEVRTNIDHLEVKQVQRSSSEDSHFQNGENCHNHAIKICIKPGDNRGFGFTVKGGKDQACEAYIDSIVKFSPADTNGLREGDKIVSLNGELVADCSHASLLFSIKQAVYTGILDIVLDRNESIVSSSSTPHNKVTTRKSAFAEKLALFSKSTSSIQEEKPVSLSAKTDDSKSESLVLKRRSAFENSQSASSVSYRRSSYISQNSFSKSSDSTEKRHSGDFSSSQLNQDNGGIKKGPPPPVPLKPKLKPKISDDFTKDDPCAIDNVIAAAEAFNTPVTEGSFIYPTPNVEETGMVSMASIDESLDSNSKGIGSQDLYFSCSTKSGSLIDPLSNEPDEQNEWSPDEKLNKIAGIPEDSFLEKLDDDPIEVTQSIADFHSSSPEIFDDDPTLDPDFVAMQSAKAGFGPNPDDPTLLQIDYCSQIENSEGYFPSDMLETLDEDLDENDVDFYEEPQESFTSLRIAAIPIQNEENLEEKSKEIIEAPADLENASAEELCDKLNSDNINVDIDISNLENDVPNVEATTRDIENYTDYTDNIGVIEENQKCYTEDDYEDDSVFIESAELNIAPKISSEVENSAASSATEEIIENAQINASPLCLPLEKIEEDDVISASTTTSSETPDTETVIETLPSNISPLPNDESNGEDSKAAAPENEKTEENDDFAPEATVVVEDNLVQSECSQESVESGANVPIAEASDSNVDIIAEELIEEYNRELDESIDQITSLDVIDELEQRLMQQLEQQDEVYEGLDDCLSEADKQWFYYSDEAGLLDDLMTRKVEPPSEPPPPPPPSDVEDATDSKASPFARVNSTRRIKKDICRRRSDFLGLDSPQDIDIDNIIPPPPGLEEILKQEREQNQWLEKRLSLAEAETTATTYSDNNLCLEEQSYNPVDYCADYFLEETDEAPEDQFHENTDEQAMFQSACDMQYSSAGMPNPSIEKSKVESPLHKAKQNIQNLGAAPKAKIMDSNKWITEKSSTVYRKAVEPVFRQASYNQNYWLEQDDARKRSLSSHGSVDRRYSMPPNYNPRPDVTVRTWGDREIDHQRPRSAVWNPAENGGYGYGNKQDVSRTHSLDGRREINCDIDTLESEAHKCSSCGKGLCEGSAMGIEALRLYFHIECFRCCYCRIQLGNGSCGTDVQVKNNQLFCPRCFTVD